MRLRVEWVFLIALVMSCVSTKGLVIRGNSTAALSTTPGDAGSGAYERIGRMDDAALAHVLVQCMLGTCPVEPSDGEGLKLLHQRFRDWVVRDETTNFALGTVVCADRGRLADPDLSAKTAESQCREHGPRFSADNALLHGRRLERAAVMPLLLGKLPDSADRSQLVDQFVRTLGYEETGVQFRSKQVGFTLREVPVDQWADWVLRHAAMVATRLQVPDLATQFSGRVKPLPDCRFAFWSIEKPHLGGGKYGELAAGDGRWLAQVSLVDGYISCQEAKKVVSDAELLRFVRGRSRRAHTLLSARFHEDGSWEVVQNRLGVPTHQRRAAVIYFAREQR